MIKLRQGVYVHILDVTLRSNLKDAPVHGATAKSDQESREYHYFGIDHPNSCLGTSNLKLGMCMSRVKARMTYIYM
jgi:hypothetical protein